MLPGGGYRLCLHSNSNELLQEMIIAHNRWTYVRPHKHLKNTESNIVLEGAALLILFNEQGKIAENCVINAHRRFTFRIGKGIYHSIVPLTAKFVYYEPKLGPFDPQDNIYAEWAPESDNREEVKQFLNHLLKEPYTC